MSIARMVLLEIGRRKRSFLLAVVAVAIASATMLSVDATLRTYDLRAGRMLAEKEAHLARQLKQLQDEMRKATIKLSFNLAVLPAAQDIAKWHAMDYAEATMPEDYVGRMGRSKLLAVRHFLPTLARKIKWPEVKRTVILVGVKGEIPNLAKAPRSPLIQPVPDGQMVIGYELQQSLNLQVGQTVTLLGREFKIQKCNAQRGSKDDIGVWIPLKDAQDLLELPGQINSILALECVCIGSSVIDKIRAEIHAVLPDTKVIEFGSKALARSEARAQVKEEAESAVVREKEQQRQLQAEREKLAGLVVPGVVAGCGVWILLLALVNARGRRSEVGILRAIGYRASQILILFLTRYLLTGVIGTAVGVGAGLGAALVLREEASVHLLGAQGLISWPLLCAALLIGCSLSVVAGWIPALLAAQRDPADVLKEA